MLNILAIPKPIKNKLEELNQLVEENPISIPLTKTAAFLGMDADLSLIHIFRGRAL